MTKDHNENSTKTKVSKSEKMLTFGISLVVFGVLSASAYHYLSHLANQSQQAGHSVQKEIGNQVPDFSLSELKEDLTVQNIELSQYSKQYLLLAFWASWCEACMEEMPSLVRLKSVYPGLKVMAVSLDEHPLRVVQRMKKNFDLTYYFDDSSAISNYFDIHAIPFTLLLNPKRELVWQQSGQIDWDKAQNRALVEQFIK